MIRRLLMLFRAVVKQGRTIQDKVTRTWPWMNVVPGFATSPAGVAVSDVAPPAPPAPRVAVAPPVAPPAPPVVVEAPAAPVVVEAPAAPVVVEAPAAPVVVEAPAAPVVVEPPASQPPVSAETAALPMRPLGAKDAIDGSVWNSRILWALEYARRHQLGPQNAAEIARLLASHAGVTVPSTNVARAFRDRKQQALQTDYWTESGEQRYEISDAGRVALTALLGA